MMVYRYFDGRLMTTTANTDREELWNSDDLEKPCVIRGLAMPAVTNKADLDIHAEMNGQEWWPAGPIEAFMDTIYLPLNQNLAVGQRYVILTDNEHATNTHDLELWVVADIGAQDGSPRTFVEQFLGSTAIDQIDRTFPVPARVRWLNFHTGPMNVRIGGKQLSPHGAARGAFTWGGTTDMTPGIAVNWPLAKDNHFVVTANAAVATQGIVIYDW